MDALDVDVDLRVGIDMNLDLYISVLYGPAVPQRVAIQPSSVSSRLD